jgi:hypothetical protein
MTGARTDHIQRGAAVKAHGDGRLKLDWLIELASSSGSR